jgi:DNA repair protein RecO (recombination protein O)
MAFISATGGSKSMRIRNSRLQPLAVIEADITVNPNRDIHKLGDFSLLDVRHTLYFEPSKSAIVFFLSEFLNRLLRESPADTLLFDYIRSSLSLLDNLSKKDAANFHIVFLSSLTNFLGIQPDVSNYSENSFFDMRAGVYCDEIPPHKDYISGKYAKLPITLSRLNYANLSAIHLTGSLRREIIDGLLHYYKLHINGLEKMKSLDILYQLFK